MTLGLIGADGKSLQLPAVADAARGAGEDSHAAWWAGQGAPMSRAMGAAELTRSIAAEMRG